MFQLQTICIGFQIFTMVLFRFFDIWFNVIKRNICLKFHIHINLSVFGCFIKFCLHEGITLLINHFVPAYRPQSFRQCETYVSCRQSQYLLS